MAEGGESVWISIWLIYCGNTAISVYNKPWKILQITTFIGLVDNQSKQTVRKTDFKAILHDQVSKSEIRPNRKLKSSRKIRKEANNFTKKKQSKKIFRFKSHLPGSIHRLSALNKNTKENKIHFNFLCFLLIKFITKQNNNNNCSRFIMSELLIAAIIYIEKKTHR